MTERELKDAAESFVNAFYELPEHMSVNEVCDSRFAYFDVTWCFIKGAMWATEQNSLKNRIKRMWHKLTDKLNKQ